MGWDTPDVYYQPEEFGLEPVAIIDYSDGCYKFDFRAVWKHKESGLLYTARDAGCSCPSPFENYTKLESLDLVTPEVYAELESEIQHEADLLEEYTWRSKSDYPDELERAEFLRKVAQAM